jgi:hypothetical protein
MEEYDFAFHGVKHVKPITERLALFKEIGHSTGWDPTHLKRRNVCLKASDASLGRFFGFLGQGAQATLWTWRSHVSSKHSPNIPNVEAFILKVFKV